MLEPIVTVPRLYTLSIVCSSFWSPWCDVTFDYSFSRAYILSYIFLPKQSKICMVLLNSDLSKIVAGFLDEYNSPGQPKKIRTLSSLLDDTF